MKKRNANITFSEAIQLIVNTVFKDVTSQFLHDFLKEFPRLKQESKKSSKKESDAIVTWVYEYFEKNLQPVVTSKKFKQEFATRIAGINNELTDKDSWKLIGTYPSSIPPSEYKIIWLGDRQKLKQLMKFVSYHGITPKTANLEKILTSKNVSLQIHPSMFFHFVWLIHSLYQAGYIKTIPRSGYLKVFENNLDWDFCGRSPKVPLKKYTSRIKLDTRAYHKIITAVAGIMKGAGLEEN